jgi:hypothetical protein
MQTEPSKADPPKPNRRWFQFSLRTLMIFTAIAAVACGWLGRKIEQKRREREAIAAIRNLGGVVNYDYQRGAGPRPSWRLRGEPSGSAWLRKLLGENFFSEIEFVGLAPRPETTDAALNAAFESLKGMPRLQFLYLTGTKINDDRLENLNPLTQLQGLELHKTKVSEAEIEKLQKALPNCKIDH